MRPDIATSYVRKGSFIDIWRSSTHMALLHGKVVVMSQCSDERSGLEPERFGSGTFATS